MGADGASESSPRLFVMLTDPLRVQIIANNPEEEIQAKPFAIAVERVVAELLARQRGLHAP